MIERARGLILRTRPFSETSIIVHWLTAELGRIATIAKGARRPKSPFRGQLDLFYLADFSFVRSRRSDLHTLREAVLCETHPALRVDLDRLQQACYCSAFVEQATETETPLPAVFELFLQLLDGLPRHPIQPQTVFAFELKLLHELGLAPDLADSKLTPGAKEIVRLLMESDSPVLVRLKLSAAQTTELRQFLHGFMIFHLGRIPKGRGEALGQVK